MKNILVSMMLVAACAAPPVSRAQTSAAVSAIDERDAKFLSEWMTLNSYEMMLTRMAAHKAMFADLRTVADKMNREHQRMDAELTAYANRYNVSIDPDKREKYVSKVEKRDADAVGEEWDRDVAEELVDAHRETVALIKTASDGVKDEALKKIASNSLPSIQAHLDELMLVKERVRKGNAALSASPAIDRTDAAREIPTGNEKDAKFYSDTRLMNAYELQLAELILKKGNHRALRDAAQQMLEEHRKLEERLAFYGKTKRYGNDPDEASKTAEKVGKWRQKKGGMEWDADIIEELIDTHKDGLDMLQDATTDVKDEQLKAIIDETIPSVKAHLDMLGPLKETVKKPWKGK